MVREFRYESNIETRRDLVNSEENSTDIFHQKGGVLKLKEKPMNKQKQIADVINSLQFEGVMAVGEKGIVSVVIYGNKFRVLKVLKVLREHQHIGCVLFQKILVDCPDVKVKDDLESVYQLLAFGEK